jgi:hypothetical protein
MKILALSKPSATANQDWEGCGWRFWYVCGTCQDCLRQLLHTCRTQAVCDDKPGLRRDAANPSYVLPHFWKERFDG